MAEKKKQLTLAEQIKQEFEEDRANGTLKSLPLDAFMRHVGENKLDTSDEAWENIEEALFGLDVDE